MVFLDDVSAREVGGVDVCSISPHSMDASKHSQLCNNDSARAPMYLFFELTRQFTNIPSIEPSRLPRRMDLRSADRARSCLRIPRRRISDPGYQTAPR